MSLNKDTALREIDAVIANHRVSEDQDHSDAIGLSTIFANCIARWSPPNSEHRKQLERLQQKYDGGASETLAILKALRADIAADRLRSFEELIHASLFDDFIAAAEYFIAEGHLLPAAVMAGGTLEEHIRQLAIKHGIALTVASGAPKKASVMNDEIAKAGAYSKPENSFVSGWLKVRNDAAHLDPAFKNHSASDIKKMCAFVREFIAKYPA